MLTFFHLKTAYTGEKCPTDSNREVGYLFNDFQY
jgi:hypothetical protein